MTVRLRITGLKEIESALDALPKSTAKGVARRVLRQSAKPIVDDAKSKVPVEEGHLRDSIAVSSKLSRSQRRFKNRKKNRVEVYAGAGPLPQAHLQEFGSRIHKAQPFMRPAWDSNKRRVLQLIIDKMWVEIRKTVARAAKRKARAQAQGQ